MTYEGGEFSTKDLFEEIKETAFREGITNVAQFRDLIDEIVEEKRIYGFFSDDEDLAQVKDDLEKRWHEVEKKLVNKVGTPIISK